MTPYIYPREIRVYHQGIEGVAEIRGVAGRAVDEVGEGILTSCSRVQVARVGPRQKLGGRFVTRDDLRGWKQGIDHQKRRSVLRLGIFGLPAG